MSEEVEIAKFLRESNFSKARVDELSTMIASSFERDNSDLFEVSSFCWTLQKVVFEEWKLSPIEMGKFHVGLKRLRG